MKHIFPFSTKSQNKIQLKLATCPGKWLVVCDSSRNMKFVIKYTVNIYWLHERRISWAQNIMNMFIQGENNCKTSCMPILNKMPSYAVCKVCRFCSILLFFCRGPIFIPSLQIHFHICACKVVSVLDTKMYLRYLVHKKKLCICAKLTYVPQVRISQV